MSKKKVEEIRCRYLEDEAILIIYNLPDPIDGVTEVHLRALTRRDRSFLREIETDENSLEYIVSKTIVKWGTKEGNDIVTALELLDDSRDQVVKILQKAYEEYFNNTFRLVET